MMRFNVDLSSVAVGPCGDFTTDMLEWSIQALGGGDYQVSTLWEVEGSEKCFLFDDSHEYDALELFRGDDASHLTLETRPGL
ncbi:MAG: hypothetical protein HN348_03800 [Proteobacteria bacterium]|jgi:hypothetical protein|nr:hypothetical protein [Pseudomonadota bacterium]